MSARKCPHRSKFQEEDGQIPPELLQKFDAESQQIRKERAASGIEDPVWDRRACPIVNWFEVGFTCFKNTWVVSRVHN